MALSSDLISQFVQVTKDDRTKKETTVYGTIVEYEGNKYVRLDGSELLTPISSTADAIDGERVTVMIKNHNAIVTGNMSSPAARTEDVKDLDNKISEFEIVIADKVSTDRLEAEIARIDTLVSENVTIKGRLDVNEASINELEANNVTINGKLEAAEAEITDLKTKKLDAEVADITYATIANLEAAQAKIGTLEATYGDFQDLTTKNFEAVNASIDDLNANKLSVKDADIKYANIDFANITQAAVEKIFSDSGIIKDLVVSSGQITGELVGVTIKGDLIEGGTVVADKLVVKGSDGLYYKLNTDGSTVESEQTEYNSLNGSVITAKSITATKISVDDLVAFGATIGGFNITKSSLYSGIKASANNTTRGIYLDKEGQFALGDASNFLKYYKAEDGSYKLEVSAQSIKFSASDKNLETALDNTIVKTVEEFYQSVSPTELSGGEWSITQPTWEEGKYIWRRTAITYGDGRSEYSPSSTGVCITGNTGAKGDTGATGNGIKSIVEHYQVSASNTTAPTSWATTVPSMSPTNKYLWNYETITYTDNTTKDTEKRIIGVYGDKGDKGDKGNPGDTGIGIKKVDNYYLATNASSNVTISTSGWTTTVQSVSSSKKYLWNYEKITYTNNTTSNTDPCIIGTYGDTGSKGDKGDKGDTGATGNGIKSIVEHYQVSASNTTAPTSWATTVPSMSPTNKYLWNYETITYTDNTTKDTEKRVIGVYGDKGNKGDTGPTGNGIKSIVEHYQVSASNTTAPTSWATTVPSMSPTNKYLWNYETITYTDNTTKDTEKRVIGVYGDKGNRGDKGDKGDPGEAGKGIASTVVEYQVSASGTIAPTGEWTSTVPETTAEMPYLWSRTIFTYTDGTTSVSYAVGSTPDGLLEIVNGEISDVRSEFKATTDSISGEVSSVTTKLYDLSSQVNKNASSFQQFADSINATIINTMVGSGEWAGLTEEMTAIKATATGLSMDVSKVTQNLDGFMAEYHTYFTATADGLRISKSGSEFATLLSDTKLSFTQSGEEVAYIQYNKLYITEAWVKSGLSIESSTNRSYIRQYVDGNGLFCIQIKEGA